MRKRRRLANKMTIMVCAVLIAVSAFFYAPMEVSAEASVPSGASGVSGSQTTITSSSGDYKTLEFDGLNVGTFSFDDSLDDDSYYIITFTSRSTLSSSKSVRLRNYLTRLVVGDLVYIVDSYYVPSSGTGTATSFESSGTYKIVGLGSDLKNVNVIADGLAYITASSQTTCKFTPSFLYWNVVVDTIAESDALALQNAYNSGYSTGFTAGEESGYDSGYSSGYSSGYADGSNDGYDEGYSDGRDDGYYTGRTIGYDLGYNAGEKAGFQAGVDSVDTQSYYDAGYQAGYDIAYQAGYDSGYEEAYDIAYENGYQSAMDRIASWGADTSDYPLLLSSGEKSEGMFSISVKTSYPFHYATFSEWTSNTEYNPNHTYRFDIDLTPLSYHEGSDDVYFLEEDIFYFNIGGIKYKISDFDNSSVNRFFIPGDRMSTAYSFSWEPYCAMMGDVMTSSSPYCYYDLSFQIYDMGPSGDTQNHIANQTDQLTNGYDDSKGNTVNSELSTGLNEFETAENSLFATATTGMKDFVFFDFESVPAMITGMSFIGSIMGSWFNQAGGASGVGIVLSILFSVILVAMVLGLYRWYQSRGGKN